MAILGFHFSGVYKEKLLDGTKKATIMSGEHFFNIGEEAQLYLSEKANLFEGVDEKRIGKAYIEEVIIKKVSELEEREATLCGDKSLKSLKGALKKWYGCTNSSVVTFIRFKSEIFR